MKNNVGILSTVIVLKFLVSCNNPSNTKNSSTDSTSSGLQNQEYIRATEAFSKDSSEFYNITSFINSIKEPEKPVFESINKRVRLSCSEAPTNRAALSSLKTVIKILSGTTSNGISVPGFGGLSLNKEEISYSVYYLEPKIVTCDGTEKVFGCGYSVHLLIKKLKRGLDVSNLPSIAANVQIDNRKTEVVYSLQTYGLSGIPIVKFFKPVINKPFDVDGFGTMQSSIDGIHGFLSDANLSNSLNFSPEEIQFVSPGDLRH